MCCFTDPPHLRERIKTERNIQKNYINPSVMHEPIIFDINNETGLLHAGLLKIVQEA